MLDDLDCLRSNPRLLEMLTHYANLGQGDRDTWHPRLLAMEQVEPSDFVKMHGQLIAFGWIELNVGQVPTCYRITLAGQQALRQAQEVDDADVLQEAA